MNDKTPPRIRIKLAEILSARNMSQRELARRTGIRHPSIYEMCENKTQRMPLDNLAIICVTLGVDITDILELVLMNDTQ
ncbi:helix-turn-helix domain-containing protein [Paenibacillus sp. GCM10012307]|uniref:helix-turn-helix domain-containing protein n=1 Tax=Paenibacillus sp. GCM10012307 TaxID=3317343 RepID=UPI00360F70A8